jgi:radical SAM protein with 4Fe4S-binding SPASM domain
MNVELTQECNLRCRHCYLEHQPGDSELSAGQWHSILRQALDFGVYFICFTGGEILSRRDFLEIVRSAAGMGLFYHFQTNGTLIDEHVADAFRELNPTKVEVSLYGSSATVHDGITRVPGSFEKTVAAVGMMRRRDIRVQVKTTVMHDNWRDVSAIRELVLRLGAGFRPDPMVMPGVRQGKGPQSMRMSDREFRRYMIAEGWHREGDDEVSRALREIDAPESRMICAAGRSRMAVSPRGEVMPCVLWRRKLGNLTKTTLEEVWFGEPFTIIRNRGIKDLKECRDCGNLIYCVRCPALAFMEVGDDTARAPESCRMSKLLKEVRQGEEGV